MSGQKSQASGRKTGLSIISAEFAHHEIQTQERMLLGLVYSVS